jgi:hypothetical protein
MLFGVKNVDAVCVCLVFTVVYEKKHTVIFEEILRWHISPFRGELTKTAKK